MELVSVYSAAGQLEAEMVKGFLAAQGIQAILNQESVGRTLGLSAGRLGKVDVMVPESQMQDARNLIAAMEAGEYRDSEFPASADEQDDSEFDN